MPKAVTQQYNKVHHSSPYQPRSNMMAAPSHRPHGLPQPSIAHERASVAWSPDDDALLMEYRAKGFNWTQISHHFNNKTANACRKRHERLMEKKNSENYDTIKTEDLANAYMEVREEMWRILAQKLGEPKWHIIETKCMEKGLKNLQTAHRSRKNSRVTHPSSPTSHHSNETYAEDPSVDFSADQNAVGPMHNGSYVQGAGNYGAYVQPNVSYSNYPSSNVYVSPSYSTMPPPTMSTPGSQTLPLPPLTHSSFTPSHLATQLPPMFNNHNNFQHRNQMISSSYA